MINIGIIGCGMIGESHIKNVLKILPSCTIHICDRSEQIVKKVAEKFRINNIYLNAKEIIENPNIESIIIASPPDTHFDLLVHCILFNKNVLVEKPLVTEIYQLTVLKELIYNNRHLVILDCSARHSVLQPKFDFVKSVVNTKEFGKIYFIHHSSVHQLCRPGVEFHPNAKWFKNINIAGGGPILDWGVYDFAFILSLLDYSPDLISFTSRFYNGFDHISKNKDFSVEEHAVVMMNFNELDFFYERASNVYNFSKNETRIYSSKMGLKFNYLLAEDNKVQIYNNMNTINQVTEVEVPTSDYLGYETDHFEMDKEFIRCVYQGYFPKFSIDKSIKNLEILLTIYNKKIIKF
jgi:predicted dehydrogenase